MTNIDVAAARPKGTFSWALWDWASQAFPTVVTSFIFGRYITSEFFAPAGYSLAEAGQYTAFWLGISGVVAGVLIALIAPIVGRRADTSGRKKFWLMVNTYLFAGTIGLMFFVAPSSDFFVFGLVLLAAGGIFFEFATVNYNSMLNEVARPHERGKISQFGWGLGYIGGIILLVMALWIIQFGGAELLGIPDTDALSVRVVMVISMFWVIIFSIPLMLKVPEAKPIAGTENEGVLLAYKKLIRSLVTMRKENPNLLKFLIASAVYRDGLNGVFAYGAVLGGIAFGLDLTEIILFGIAANIVAGIGAFVGSFFEDRVGSRKIIFLSLVGVIVGGFGVFIFESAGTIAFFSFGLFLCTFVGPAQAASRTMMSRLSADDKQGEAFGLYATTGRAVSFLAPAAWAIFVGLFSPIYGILGLMLILVVGLLLLISVRAIAAPAAAS
ncbi:MFS transporter [Aquiluna sp. Uisw_065]|uniref:MFS transporter n=1 Tax=Aquiluna sp. Uisw_065 TaxID=3230967 RepID=UPI0039EBCABA